MCHSVRLPTFGGVETSTSKRCQPTPCSPVEFNAVTPKGVVEPSPSDAGELSQIQVFDQFRSWPLTGLAQIERIATWDPPRVGISRLDENRQKVIESCHSNLEVPVLGQSPRDWVEDDSEPVSVAIGFGAVSVGLTD